MVEFTQEGIKQYMDAIVASGQAVSLSRLPKGTRMALFRGRWIFVHPDHPPIVETETGYQTLLPGLPAGNRMTKGTP